MNVKILSHYACDKIDCSFIGKYGIVEKSGTEANTFLVRFEGGLLAQFKKSDLFVVKTPIANY